MFDSDTILVFGDYGLEPEWAPRHVVQAPCPHEVTEMCCPVGGELACVECGAFMELGGEG